MTHALLRSAARTPLLLCGLFGALTITGCDSEPGASQLGLEVQVVKLATAPDPFQNVGLVVLEMAGDELNAEFRRVLDYAPGVMVDIDDVPFGTNRQLTIEGWTKSATDEPGQLISRGRSEPVEVKEGADAQLLRVLMAQVNTFLPLTDLTTQTAQGLVQGRVGHAVTPTETGEVVISGGGIVTDPAGTWWNHAGFAQLSSSIEAVDTANAFVANRSPLLESRVWHTGTALSSGQLVIAGGYGAAGSPLRSVELYNPPTVLDGTGKPLPPLAVARAGHTATLLNDTSRQILFVGGDAVSPSGQGGGTWELWDPVNGSSGVRPMPDALYRRHHTATTFFLPGRIEPAVLFTGGESDEIVHSTAMLYDSVATTIIGLPAFMPSGARTQHTSTYVPNRNFIYIAGGFTNKGRTQATSNIDVFDISTQTFLPDNGGFRMRSARGGHSATLNPNNTIVVTGGIGDDPPLDGALAPLNSIDVIFEFLDPATGVLRIEVASSISETGQPGAVPLMPQQRFGHRSVALDNGMTLMVGGAAANPAGGLQMVTPLGVYNPL